MARTPTCHPALTHYAKGLCRPCYFRKAVKGRTQRIREWLKQVKNVPCQDCGQRFPPYVMDFDHRDASTNRFNLGDICSQTFATVLEEIEKCDIVCANCHRIRTYNP